MNLSQQDLPLCCLCSTLSQLPGCVLDVPQPHSFTNADATAASKYPSEISPGVARVSTDGFATGSFHYRTTRLLCVVSMVCTNVFFFVLNAYLLQRCKGLYSPNPRAGPLGIYMAHLIALHACQQVNASRCLIFEDDIPVPTKHLHIMKMRLERVWT